MTKAKRWGDLSDEKASMLLRKLLVGNQYQPLEQIKATFARLSGHRVEAHIIPVQTCAINLRFAASGVRRDAPLKDVPHYEKIDWKDVAVGIVAMTPDGAVLLQLGEAAAILWKDGDRWVTIIDEDLNGKPLHESSDKR